MAQTAANYIQVGDSIDYTPVGAVAAGAVVVLGTIVGVAKVPIAAGEQGALAVYGAFDLPKTSDAFAAGDTVFWNASGNPVTGDSGSGAADSETGVLCGVAIAAAEAGDSYVRVRLSTVTERSVSVGGSVTADDITGSDSTLTVTGAAGSTSAGGAVTLAGGAGDGTTNAGGAVSMTGGVGAVSGAGGAATVSGGAGGSTTGVGGAATLKGGAGTNNNMAGGAVIISGGAPHGSGLSGAVRITTPLFVPQGAPTAKTTAATLTNTEIRTGLLTGTHSAGATAAYTLPTGTNMSALGALADGDAFDWTLINLSSAEADTITVTASTDHTIVGSGVVLSAHSSTAAGGNSARFRSRKSSGNTWITYRIG